MRFIFKSAMVLVLLVLVAAPAMANTSVLTKKDPKGDVTIYKPKFISKAKKKSIDIDKTSVVLLDNGKYRFKVWMKKLHTSKKWDQMVFFETSTADSTELVSVDFKVRNSGGAYAYNSVTEELCSLKVKRKGRTVWVDVPARCAPADGQQLRLDTATGHYQTDAPIYSRDHVYVGAFSTT